jgi:hypothetical protein
MMMNDLIAHIDFELKAARVGAHKIHDSTKAVLEACKEALQQSRWVSVEDLPELGEPVILTNINEWENTGGDLVRNVQDCGYLSEFGAKYWSIRGQGAKSINAYTHYQLVTPPTKEQGS